jgi:50S ribosome-binding GTPase
MTMRVAPAARPPPLDEQDPLHRCLEALLAAADAAEELGLPTEAARGALADALRRVGFPGDTYVLAFVGGTGVGKSSLLNALAGTAVSRASVRRPTTSHPIAWVPAADRESLWPLLEWVGVHDVREHEGRELGPVAILDLPDMDSLETDHRERVEGILPRVDAVAWVTDPEKYHDAVLADDFLRSWLPRLSRQIVIVNKADRLASVDALRIRHDLEHDLALARVDTTAPRVPVMLTSAAPSQANGSAPTPDVHDVRQWLSDGVIAKAVVRGRIAATALAHGLDLAIVAGIDPAVPSAPYVAPEARTAAVQAATEAVLRAVDLPGLERQAEAATRERARSRGTGPIGRLTSVAYRASGRAGSVADPESHLLRWRERGSLSPAVQALRDALGTSVRDAGPRVRPILATALEPTELRTGLERAVDRAVRSLGPLEAPSSGLWPLLGLLQSISTLGIALSVGWLVLIALGGPASATVEVPLLGDVPTPMATLVAFVVIGYLLARLVRIHAGWIGKRWARAVRARVAAEVRAEVAERGLAPLDAIEDARTRLAVAAATLDQACGARA